MINYDPVAKIRELLPSEPGNYSFSESNAVHLMVLIRTILERDNAKNKYTTLNLYCNWTVHTELEGSRVGYRMLSDITRILSSQNHQAVDDHVSHVLSLGQLRQDLIQVLTAEKVPVLLLNSVLGWEKVAGQIFKAIINKRLLWPKDPSNDKYSSKIYRDLVRDVQSPITISF